VKPLSPDRKAIDYEEAVAAASCVIDHQLLLVARDRHRVTKQRARGKANLIELKVKMR
jgi:hypothetical protein